MGSKNQRFAVDMKETGLLAESVWDMVMKKTSNPAEALVVLKMALAFLEAYMKHVGISFDTKDVDAYVSKFMKDFLGNWPGK